MDTIDFTPDAVKGHLDKCITHWRGKRDSEERDSLAYEQARCYVDAFQSVRVSLFGEVLGDDNIGKPYDENAKEWMGGESRATLPPENGTIGDPNRS